jgi:hypothetical protein
MFTIPDHQKKYCKPSNFCESNDKKINELALHIIGKEKNPKNAVEKLFLYVRDNLGWNFLYIIGARKILRRKRKTAICIDNVSLFNALCRSIGIPARYVFMICEFDFKNQDLPRASPHIVSEIFLDGKWIIVDPTFGKIDEKILDIKGFGEETWKGATVFLKLRGLPASFILLANIWIHFSPLARGIRRTMNSVHGRQIL